MIGEVRRRALWSSVVRPSSSRILSRSSGGKSSKAIVGGGVGRGPDGSKGWSYRNVVACEGTAMANARIERLIVSKD